jgi:hypothetical protein
MIKKTVVFLVILTVAVMFVVPINADPTDVVLDQQVTLEIPGRFELADWDNDQRPEAVKVKVRLHAYRQGDFQITGKLAAKQDDVWVKVGSVVKPFQWSTANDTVELVFNTGAIRRRKLSGPYRASISVRDGDWKLPLQIVGFSPKYPWDSFAHTK